MRLIESEISLAVSRVTKMRKLLKEFKQDPDMYADEIDIVRKVTNRRNVMYDRMRSRDAALEELKHPESLEKVAEFGKQIDKLEEDIIVLCYRISVGWHRMGSELGMEFVSETY